jgi:hypothetical protein
MRIAAVALLLSAAARADEPADREAIKATVLDYIESWYTADADRMERALHPELAKRIVQFDPKTNRQRLGGMGATALVEAVRAGYGTKTPAEKQRKDVTVLDVDGDVASAKLVAAEFDDYLHLARWKGRWVIVNVLWRQTHRPEPK